MTRDPEVDLMKRSHARRIVALSASMIGPALRTAAVISLVRKLGARRTGRLLAAAAGRELARSRRG
jgi:hypothetical protein